MRISEPNYTQTPNELIDHWLPHLKECELKVLLVIIRKTFGWHKNRDRISLSQFQKLTGSSATNVLNSLNSLIEKGLVQKEVYGPEGKQVTYYELVVYEDSNNSYPSQLIRGTTDNLGGGTPDNLSVTKETNTKETIQKKQQQAAPAAVAVFFDCLKEVNIPENEKVSLSLKFSEEVVRNAVGWALHPKTVIKTTLTQAIKWACQEKPSIPKDEIDIIEENKKFIKSLERCFKTSPHCYVDILNKSVIICFHSQRSPIVIEYSDPAFKEQLNNDLRKFDLI